MAWVFGAFALLGCTHIVLSYTNEERILSGDYARALGPLFLFILSITLCFLSAKVEQNEPELRKE